MSTATSAQLEKVQKVSAVVRDIFKLLFAMTVIGAVIGALVLFATPSLPRPLGWTLHLPGMQFAGESVTRELQVIGIASAAIGVGIQLKILWHLIKLFGLYAAGSIFTVENVRHIRQLGITTLLIPLWWLAGFIAAASIAGSMPPESVTGPSLPLTPSFALSPLLTGVVVLLASWVMDVGRELREESDLVV